MPRRIKGLVKKQQLNSMISKGAKEVKWTPLKITLYALLLGIPYVTGLIVILKLQWMFMAIVMIAIPIIYALMIGLIYWIGRE